MTPLFKISIEIADNQSQLLNFHEIPVYKVDSPYLQSLFKTLLFDDFFTRFHSDLIITVSVSYSYFFPDRQIQVDIFFQQLFAYLNILPYLRCTSITLNPNYHETTPVCSPVTKQLLTQTLRTVTNSQQEYITYKSIILYHVQFHYIRSTDRPSPRSTEEAFEIPF